MDKGRVRTKFGEGLQNITGNLNRDREYSKRVDCKFFVMQAEEWRYDDENIRNRSFTFTGN